MIFSRFARKKIHELTTTDCHQINLNVILLLGFVTFEFRTVSSFQKTCSAKEPEVWPQNPRYFAATIAMHLGGGGMSVGCIMGVAHQWRGGMVAFGLYLVDGLQGGGIYGMGVKQRSRCSRSLRNTVELQYYFAPFSKAVK